MIDLSPGPDLFKGVLGEADGGIGFFQKSRLPVLEEAIDPFVNKFALIPHAAVDSFIRIESAHVEDEAQFESPLQPQPHQGGDVTPAVYDLEFFLEAKSFADPADLPQVIQRAQDRRGLGIGDVYPMDPACGGQLLQLIDLFPAVRFLRADDGDRITAFTQSDHVRQDLRLPQWIRQTIVCQVQDARS